VKSVRMFMERGFITGMCGDGGNDCGALRAAHVGVALSEAEASVVSPFTSHSKSVMSVVDLLREGRGSLATSFASYKFLIIYGQMFSVVKLASYYFGVLMSPVAYITIDGVAVVALSYFMTLSEPRSRLHQCRPSSSLLSNVTIASVCGAHAINIMVLIIVIHMVTSHPDYVKWPSKLSSMEIWWELSDNWESTMLFAVVFPQFITTAIVFSFGAKFRRGVRHNLGLLVFWAVFLVFSSCLLLMDPNEVTRIYHYGSDNFNGEGTPYNIWQKHQANGGRISSGMPFKLRFKIWCVISAGLVLMSLWEFVFIIGPGRPWIFPKRGTTHPDLKP